MVLLKQLEKEFGVDPIKVGGRAVRRGLKVIEQIAKEHNKRYLLDEDVTMVDVLLVPQLYVGRVFGIKPEEEFPYLGQLEQKLLQIPEFEAAHPLNMEDAPSEEAALYKKKK